MSISLKIPFIQDPRTMTLCSLKCALRKRGLSDSGSKEELCVRLLNVIVNEGLQNIPDPLCMDDRQPEKWHLIASQQLHYAEKIEPNSKLRIKTMEEVNRLLGQKTIRNSRRNLMIIACGGDLSIFNNLITDNNLTTELHKVLMRFGAALMFAPIVESEIITEYADILGVGSLEAHHSVASSRTMFAMCTGFMAIPQDLTKWSSLLNSKMFRNLTVKIGSVFSCVIFRNTLFRVIRVELDSEMNQIIVLQPFSVEFGDNNIELKTTFVEFDCYFYS